MKIYIVMECYNEWVLMEIFDSRKKANAYIKMKEAENGDLITDNPYKTIKYEIIMRKVL